MRAAAHPTLPAPHRLRRPRTRLGAALLVGLAGLLAAAGAVAQLEAFPPAPEAPVEELLGPAIPIAPRRAAPLGDATARAERLKNDPLHGDRFFVRGVAGDATASKVVYLVPQYHRSSTTPLSWTSVGRAIVEVQTNIEALVLALEATEGVRCVGTEGSWDDPIPFPFEHRRLAYLLDDLRRERGIVAGTLQEEAREEDLEQLEVLELVLTQALKERAGILDGVGAAQARLRDVGLDRFGLEDRDLNQRAVGLRQKLDALDRQLAELDTSTVSAFQSKLGEIWLSEIELYEEATLRPLDEARGHLEQTRMALRRGGAEHPSRLLGRYLAVVERIDAEAIRSGEVRATTEHYRAVAKELREGAPSQAAPTRKLTRKERRLKRRLEKRRARLSKRYEKITVAERERLAAERVLLRINRPEHDACVMVYGAGHRESLERTLVEVGAQTGLGPVGIVTVEPFELTSE